MKHNSNKFNKLPINTPRNNQFVSEVRNIYTEEMEMHKLKTEFKDRQQFLPILIMSIRKFRSAMLSQDPLAKNKEIDLWKRLLPYLECKKIPPYTPINHNSNMFFIVESGVVNLTHHLIQGNFCETMSSKTAYGVINSTKAESSLLSISSDTECVLRFIDSDNLIKMKVEDPELFTELILLTLAIHRERSRELLGFSLISM